MTIRKAKRILSLANALAARRVMHLRQAARILPTAPLTWQETLLRTLPTVPALLLLPT